MKLTALFTMSAAAIALAMGLSTLPVFGHARYDSSTPSKGEILAVSPSMVEITFSNDIQKVSGTFGITVTRDRGADVTAGPSAVNDADRTKLSVPLQPGLADGRYVVNYKNVSDEDGDPYEGAFSFYINYQPNAVDLANDAQLEQIGAEDDPTPAGTAPATSPSSAATITTTTPPAEQETEVAASPTPTDLPDDEDDDSSALLIVAIVVAVVLIAVAGGVLVMRRRR
jgi:methionine-rich copper-binding protein CopC